jgi:hypothetical protein
MHSEFLQVFGTTPQMRDAFEFMKDNDLHAPYPHSKMEPYLKQLENNGEDVSELRDGLQMQYICYRINEVYKDILPYVPHEFTDRGLVFATNILQTGQRVYTGMMMNKPVEEESDGWILFVQRNNKRPVEYLMMPNDPVEFYGRLWLGFGFRRWDYRRDGECRVVSSLEDVDRTSKDTYIQVNVCPGCHKEMQFDPMYTGKCKACDANATEFKYF